MINKVCRLCLVKPPVHFSLEDSIIAHMLEALTFSKVEPRDEISTIICLKCLLSLKLAYNFQQRIKKSEKKLLEEVKIKHEVCDESLNNVGDDLVKLCHRNCPLCGNKVKDKLINDHIREHFRNEQKCGFCDKIFIDIERCREHLFEHPEKDVHRCPKCGATFQYRTFYDLHITNFCPNKINRCKKSTKLKRPSALDNLDNETTRNKILKLGLRSSEAIKLLTGTTKDEGQICKICFKKFTKKSFQSHSHETKTCNICNREVSKYGYKKHVDEHTLGPQVCHLCGATLQNKNCLAAHIFYSHNELRYKCEQCGKSFQKKVVRDMHVQKEHVGEPTHYCDKCGKGFFGGRFLKRHIKTAHLKLRPHICQYCQKGYSSRYALKTHIRQHTKETPYRCEVCGEGFRQNVSLRVHRKSKHDIIEENICSCKFCGKEFASDSALHSHMRLH